MRIAEEAEPAASGNEPQPSVFVCFSGLFMLVGILCGSRHTLVVRQKKMLRVAIYFLAPITIGVLLIPFGIWAAFGFPGEGSHGLWIPAMFAAYVGLPAGLLIGIVAATVCFFRWRAKKKKETIAAVDAAMPEYTMTIQKPHNENGA